MNGGFTNGGGTSGEDSSEPEATQQPPIAIKFNAAIKVIQNLPKDGPYQPSNLTKLRFYGLFKQATEGPCSQSRGRKPAFWDVINRAKWEAWNKIGDKMTKEEAMHAYVDELKQMMVDYMMEMGLSMSNKIVETMSFNGDVQEFLSAIGPFYEFVTPLPGHEVKLSSSSAPPSDLITQAIDSIIENDRNSSGSSPSPGGSPSSANRSRSSSRHSSPELTPEKVKMLQGVKEVMSKAKEMKLIPGTLQQTPDTLLGKVLNLQGLPPDTSLAPQSSNKPIPNGFPPIPIDFTDVEGHTRSNEGHMSPNPVPNGFKSFNSDTEDEEYYSDDGGMNLTVLPVTRQGSGVKVRRVRALEATVERLNRDIEHILARLRILETAYYSGASASGTIRSSDERSRSFLGRLMTFGGGRRSRVLLNGFLLIVWPFLIHFLIRLYRGWSQRRRSRVTGPLRIMPK